MTRDRLEHAIRAACDVAEDSEVFVFGSQAIVGQFPDAPESLRQSAEADIAPVHGVPIEAAVLPAGCAQAPARITQRPAVQGRFGEQHRVPLLAWLAGTLRDLGRAW